MKGPEDMHSEEQLDTSTMGEELETWVSTQRATVPLSTAHSYPEVLAQAVTMVEETCRRRVTEQGYAIEQVDLTIEVRCYYNRVKEK